MSAASRTIEYPAPNPNEANHVRAPGRDYFDCYSRVFSAVRVYASVDVRAEIPAVRLRGPDSLAQ